MDGQQCSRNDDYHDSFVEDFSDTTLVQFRYGSSGNKSEFKYKLGVNSPTAEGTQILSFKIDPTEKAGAGRGPEMIEAIPDLD
jgi:hypothetical protein